MNHVRASCGNFCINFFTGLEFCGVYSDFKSSLALTLSKDTTSSLLKMLNCKRVLDMTIPR